jgi:Tol biopolymer transport system component/serine/threonine protein kinase
MTGTTVGHYKVLERLGAGGMGVVYKARDVNLGRLVALKFLPEGFAGNSEMLERLRREARLASALNHPNICTIYEIGQQDGQYFIAMELLEGQPLSSLIVHKPLTTDKVLDLGIQLSSALEAAHSAGIVHRDLKPANIFISSRGAAKILDFGLAISTQAQRHIGAAVDKTASLDNPHLTSPGTTVGTMAYMSPEQALGEELDARSDLFSLGVVLYEMGTGVLPFQGPTPGAIFNAIINQAPVPMGRVNPAISPKLEQIVASTLEKTRDLRCQNAAALNADLKRLKRELESSTVTTIPRLYGRTRQPLSRARMLGLLVALLLVALGAYFLARLSLTRHAPVAAKLVQLTTDEGLHEFPAWSPDGKRVVYSKELNGFKKLFVQEFQSEPRQITFGNADDIQPRWTPDGKAILLVRSKQPRGKLEPGDVFGTYEGGDIWRKDLASGNEEKFLSDAYNPSFSPDGKTIAVDASWAGPRRIWIVDAQGHNPLQITSDNSEAVDHVGPGWSPDGKKLVFQNVERTKFSIKVVNVASRSITAVTDGRFQDTNPVWSHSGKHIYFSSYRGGGLNIWRIHVSDKGQADEAPQQITMGSGQDVQLAMSADGKKLAFSILRQNADLWRLPVSPQTGIAAGNPEEVLASTREDSRGAWSPDGTRIAFNSDRGGEMNLYVHSLVDGTNQQITNGPGGDFQPQWSPDGRELVFFSSRTGNADIWLVDAATKALKQLTSNPSLDINPFFSPDGTQIAFQSDRSGRMEVWVMNRDGSDQRQIEKIGVLGHFVRWSNDSKDVIFRCPCAGKSQIYQVSVKGGDPVPLNPEIAGGSHISFSPSHSLIMDVVNHKTLTVSPVDAGRPIKVFEFPDGESRIDYPVWSPDGKWVIFDRFRPRGGDLWALENFE